MFTLPLKQRFLKRLWIYFPHSFISTAVSWSFLLPQVVRSSRDSRLRLIFLGRKSPIEAYCCGFWLFSNTQKKQTSTAGAIFILELVLPVPIPCRCPSQQSTSIAVFIGCSLIFATPGEGKRMRCASKIPCWLYMCLSWGLFWHNTSGLFSLSHLLAAANPKKKIYLIWASSTIESTPVTVTLFAPPWAEKEHKVISSDL